MKINPLGIIAGILMLALPFLGAWWIFGVGELFILKISPFNVNVLMAGEQVESPLFQGIARGITLVVLIIGILVILGSFFADRWWGVKLIRFGSFKVLNLVVSLALVAAVILPVIGSRINQMVNLPVEFNIPVQGEQIISYQQQGMSLSVSIYSNFTEVFFLACITAGIAIYSRIYLNKMLKDMKGKTESSEEV